MNIIFYLAAAVAVVSTLLVITRLNAVHALLYLIVSLLAVALIFFLLGAPFAAALEIIIYAGAIIVFVIMMLNLGVQSVQAQKQWLRPGMWVGPGALAVILLGELVYLLTRHGGAPAAAAGVGPEVLGRALFGPYMLGVELTSVLLMAGLVGAYHLARPEPPRAGEGAAP